MEEERLTEPSSCLPLEREAVELQTKKNSSVENAKQGLAGVLIHGHRSIMPRPRRLRPRYFRRTRLEMIASLRSRCGSGSICMESDLCHLEDWTFMVFDLPATNRVVITAFFEGATLRVQSLAGEPTAGVVERMHIRASFVI